MGKRFDHMITLLIHGGAGAMSPQLYSEIEIEEFKEALLMSLDIGFALLSKKETALDVVATVVASLEDCPLFNAGRGSVLASNEKIQMDASIMCGLTQQFGAVTLVEKVKNPIRAAKLVLEKTPHRILGGADADFFASRSGLEIMDPSYFLTPKRKEQLEQAKEKGKIQLDHDGDASNTVGAVALDAFGNLAAATSTGGLTNKMPGRISDSCILGAGTYANNSTLALSATGMGDVFIQNVSGFDAHAMMLYKKYDLARSCQTVLDKVKQSGGNGGLIAVSSAAQIFIGFNSGGMFRAMKSADGRFDISIF